ncbi:MAG: phosphatidylserine decarboxylase [Kiritimatiellae bacterium]|nr:phosphatidylserine decarboxylase [Kiritimatiellia bacterium]
MIKIRVEVWPFVGFAVLGFVIVMMLLKLLGVKLGASLPVPLIITTILSLYFLYFFRDPERTIPIEENVIVSGADGTISTIQDFSAEDFATIAQKTGLAPNELGALSSNEVTRISIYLSLFSVHVNRAPIAGQSSFLGYFPGKHYLTLREKSSEHNQHNSILIENESTCCLVNQIVGPICRRVVYWPDHDKHVTLARGERFGMMKFGSRLDIYFPKDDIEVIATENQKVTAGETVIAKLKI